MIKRNIKMRVTPEESKQVQEICFANGISWKTGSKKVLLEHKQYLIICDCISWDDKERYFGKNLEEVNASLFIKTQGTCVEETPEQELKQNINKEETMEKNEVENYADVKEYLIAKGLYERVLNLWEEDEEYESFSDLFTWTKTKEGVNYWTLINEELMDLGINKKIESLMQDYKAKQGKESSEYIEVQPEEVVEAQPTSYSNVKEYLIAKGLYEDILSFNIDFNGYSPYFGNMFWFGETPQGHEFWDKINSELVKLKINDKLDEILEDYKVKKLEVKLGEAPEQPPEKPKQYLCYVQGKALPKHIHKTLEHAKQEAQRLCRKELAKVSVLEVVAEYEAEVIVKEV